MKFAFIFPGQGSQSLHMMDKLKDHHAVKEIFYIAQNILHVDFLKMLANSTADEINQTTITQPLMLCSGYATYATWCTLTNKTPSILAGHSLGEWIAMIASGVLSFEDALHVVNLRAQYMQSEADKTNGAMAAVIGLDKDNVNIVCNEIAHQENGVIAGVNFNSKEQVVIAGEIRLINIAIDKLKQRGAKRVQILPVSVPSHCMLMKPAAEKLSKEINNVKFSPPKIPILHNISGLSYNNVEDIKNALIQQLYSPVLWVSIIENMVKQEVTTIIECGPGKILSNLNKRIDGRINNYNIHSIEDVNAINNILNQ